MNAMLLVMAASRRQPIEVIVTPGRGLDNRRRLFPGRALASPTNQQRLSIWTDDRYAIAASQRVVSNEPGLAPRTTILSDRTLGVGVKTQANRPVVIPDLDARGTAKQLFGRGNGIAVCRARYDFAAEDLPVAIQHNKSVVLHGAPLLCATDAVRSHGGTRRPDL